MIRGLFFFFIQGHHPDYIEVSLKYLLMSFFFNTGRKKYSVVSHLAFRMSFTALIKKLKTENKQKMN